MSDYYAEVKMGRGAVFIAVCRGKVAEGLDFADDYGRAVLVLGLPYPPFKDPRVELKRQFLDDQVRAKTGQLSGSKWYSLEAFRATNQAIGRVIRHSRDHGAVIFLDGRFGNNNAKFNLSRWLQPFFKTYKLPGPAAQDLAKFFKSDSELGKERKAAVEEKTAAIAASKSKKRTHIEMKFEEEEMKPSGPQTKDYLVGAKAGKPVESDSMQRASDIYSTSSSAIGFSRGTYQNEQNAPTRTAPLPIPHQLAASQHSKRMDRENSAPKRKRIKLLSNPSIFPTSASVEETSKELSEIRPGQRPEKEVLANYVMGLKKFLGKEMPQFIKTIRAYKSDGDFEELTNMVESLIVPHLKVQPSLLKDFKTFVKSEDKDKFQAFLEKHE